MGGRWGPLGHPAAVDSGAGGRGWSCGRTAQAEARGGGPRSCPRCDRSSALTLSESLGCASSWAGSRPALAGQSGAQEPRRRSRAGRGEKGPVAGALGLGHTALCVCASAHSPRSVRCPALVSACAKCLLFSIPVLSSGSSFGIPREPAPSGFLPGAAGVSFTPSRWAAAWSP